MNEKEIEQKLYEFFEENYARLQLEGGQALTADVKKTAFDQVLQYWRKLRHVAQSVTDTEVHLSLPEQKTPEGRRFTLEGIVDIVRETDKTTMYDIKTHDSAYVRDNIDLYDKQLNVYAHIWQNLRGERLDETAVISTAIPETLNEAFSRRDAAVIGKEWEKWEPLIEIPLKQESVEATIEDFGRIVDLIESKQFAPPPVSKLKSKSTGTKRLYAAQVCRSCDARFSCESYRNYVSSTNKQFQGFGFLNEEESDRERTDRVTMNLESAPPLKISTVNNKFQ